MRWFRASLKHLFCASTFVVKIAHFARPEIVIAIRMKHYFKRQWEETTGDELTDTWGTSTYFVETDEQFNVIRQIQVFEKGQVLKYAIDNTVDEFGMLSDQQLDITEFEEFLIDEKEFSDIWDKLDRKII